MQPRFLVQSAAAVTLILFSAAPAFANSLASWIWIWPGAVSLDPFFGLLPTILVAFLERPFISRAGINSRPLMRSIRANLLSLLAGIPLAMFVWDVNSLAQAAAFTAAAVSITILVELAYFRSVARAESCPLHGSWIVLGNLFSNLLLIGIALTVKTVGTSYPQLGRTLEPYQHIFGFAHLAISFSLVGAALARPTINVFRALFVPDASSMEKVLAELRERSATTSPTLPTETSDCTKPSEIKP